MLFSTTTNKIKDYIVDEKLQKFIIEGDMYFLFKISNSNYTYLSYKDNTLLQITVNTDSENIKSECLEIIEKLGFNNSIISKNNSIGSDLESVKEILLMQLVAQLKKWTLYMLMQLNK